MAGGLRPEEGRRSLAAASGLSFAGAAFSALFGFLLTVVLGRSFGAAGAGAVLQGAGAFTIALGVAKLGLDTTAVWLLPRSRREDPGAVRGTVRGLLVVGLAAGLVVAGVLAVASPLLFGDPDVARTVRSAMWFLPAAVVTTVALAATRGLGGVGAYVLLNQVAVPGLRPVLVLAVGALGGGALAATVTWAGVLGVAAVPALVVAWTRVRRLETLTGAEVRGLERAVIVQAVRFTLPRAVSSAIEQAQQWLDVVIVGVLAGPAAAGVYGAATRFVNAGMIPSTSMRIVVAPQFSAALHQRDYAAAQDAYRTTTAWITVLSAPLYVMLWLYGGTALSLLGEGFRDGAVLLGVLSIGAMISSTTGNVQSMLLMSGRSGWVAANKTIVLVVFVMGLAMAVPQYGAMGAAVVWSAAYAVDAVLAMVQVSRLVGIRLDAHQSLVSLAVGVVPFALAGLVGRLWLGDSVRGLLVGASLGTLLYVAAVWLVRRRLDLGEVLLIVRRRGGRGTSDEEVA
jgi:O-antigen/teichoic acid export membrane protein